MGYSGSVIILCLALSLTTTSVSGVQVDITALPTGILFKVPGKFQHIIALRAMKLRAILF